MSHIPEGELLESGANTNIVNTITWDTNIMQNYEYMYKYTEPFVQRSYEDGRWYYIVCKPFDKQYQKHNKWFTTTQFMNSVKCSLRKYCKDDEPDMFLVKEKDAPKHHINVLICTCADLNFLDNKNNNKYKFYCRELIDQGDRSRVRDYMIKESKHRYFKEYDDYRMELYDSQVLISIYSAERSATIN